jgi:hypothetical protein
MNSIAIYGSNHMRNSIASIKAPKPTPAANVQNFIKSQLNQLIIKGTNAEKMDAGATPITGREDSPVEALGAIDRSQNPAGQSQS